MIALWRTHSCVQRSHSCERDIIAQDRRISGCRVGTSADAARTSACATAVFLLLALAAPVAFAQMPAGNRPAVRSESGTSVLPGGRFITPLGEQFFTGPGPFGLAISPSGQFVVTADGGPNRYALTVLDNHAGAVKHLYAARKRSRGEARG